MSSQVPAAEPKKGRKNTRKKADLNPTHNINSNPYVDTNEIKSIKIPEKFEEKEKLLQVLRGAIGDINLKIKNLTSKREYYTEIVDLLTKELKERRDRQLQLNKDSNQISVIQEELFSKNLIKLFIALHE